MSITGNLRRSWAIKTPPMSIRPRTARRVVENTPTWRLPKLAPDSLGHTIGAEVAALRTKTAKQPNPIIKFLKLLFEKPKQTSTPRVIVETPPLQDLTPLHRRRPRG